MFIKTVIRGRWILKKVLYKEQEEEENSAGRGSCVLESIQGEERHEGVFQCTGPARESLTIAVMGLNY